MKSKEIFEKVWKIIGDHSGEKFHTIRGLRFTYQVKGNIIIPSRTEYNIPKSDFEKAFHMVPFDGPGRINKFIRGSSYVWAILHDKRIMNRIGKY